MSNQISLNPFTVCFIFIFAFGCEMISAGYFDDPVHPSYNGYHLSNFNEVLRPYENNFLIVVWCDPTIIMEPPKHPLMLISTSSAQANLNISKLSSTFMTAYIKILLVMIDTSDSIPRLNFFVGAIKPALLKMNLPYPVDVIGIGCTGNFDDFSLNFKRVGYVSNDEFILYWMRMNALKESKTLKLKSTHMLCTGRCLTHFSFLFSEVCKSGFVNCWNNLQTSIHYFFTSSNQTNMMKFLLHEADNKHSYMVTELKSLLEIRDKNRNQFPFSFALWSIKSLTMNELVSPHFEAIEHHKWRQTNDSIFGNKESAAVYHFCANCVIQIENHIPLRKIKIKSNSLIEKSYPMTFLTCYGLQESLLFTDYVNSFDRFIWIFLVISFIAVTILASGFITIYQDSNFLQVCPKIGMKLYASMLNTSTSEFRGHTHRITWALRLLFGTWMMTMFILNNTYQNLVISNVIKPLKVTSPWNNIEELENFTKFVPLFDNIVEYDGLVKMSTGFSGPGSTVRYFQFQTPYGGHQSNVFNRFLFGNVVPDWVFSAPMTWFYNTFGRFYLQWYNTECIDSVGITNRSNCGSISSMLKSLKPLLKLRGQELLQSITSCSEKTAYIDSSENINLIFKVLTQGRHSKKFVKGLPETKYEDILVWNFKYRLGCKKDIFYERMKIIYQSGIYGMWEEMLNPLSESVLQKLKSNHSANSTFDSFQVGDADKAQSLASSIVSVFYIYLIGCVLAIVVFSVESLSLIWGKVICKSRLC